jgi:hypothetical protein
VGHEHRAESLNDLGDALFHFCYHHGTDQIRIDRCIEVLREALRLRPPGHLLRDQSLHNLARSLHFVLYRQLNSLEIILECASLNREASLIRSPGHPERLKSMNNLANDLARIFEHTGDVEILAEMVSMRRDILQMHSPDDSSRHTLLNNLGSALFICFQRLGRSEILAEAISVIREAMPLRPMGHPECFRDRDNLARALYLRSIHEGHSESLTEAIDLQREALLLLTDNHPERVRVMVGLAESLLAAFRIGKNGDELAQAISLLRQAVLMVSPGGYTFCGTLQALAEALEEKYGEDNNTETLSEAVALYRETLRLRPLGHQFRFLSLEDLARVLCKIGCQSWPEALLRYQEALQVCPAGYPARARLLSGMCQCFLNPSSPFFSLSEGISCLSKAYAHTFSHVSGRLKSAVLDLRQLESAYESLTEEFSTAWNTQHDERILDLYTQVIGLLPLAANFGLDHGARLRAVAGSDEVARNAVTRALLLSRVSQAVELLEQGRGVFWTQTLHLRTTVFDGVFEADCQELQRMLWLLDLGARQVEGSEHSVEQSEQELERRRQLNEAVQALIARIRGYPGLDRFLLAPVFDVLLSSLPDGFVVIVNTSKLGCHALLLQRDTGFSKSLELKPFHTRIDCAKLRAKLPRDTVSALESTGENDTRAMRLNNGRAADLEDALYLLWTSIVLPIVEALGLLVSEAILDTRAVTDGLLFSERKDVPGRGFGGA